ncbi:hypothetical protein TUM4261_15830 [Shewanella sp. c952]|uniref:hypothetical protein n=1 Tax=Shewanella sp. c952 TaxID=2815913 RepID=UPI001BC2139D|nr:hypothetical protein [Shewanella sp. c952]GIU08707.1 hypothetical protein TUM4261_15830 [Shewanella sp. c952]
MEEASWYKKPEMIVALSALLISVVTTMVGVYSAHIDRAYARASVWPRLEIFRSFGNDNFSYGVSNNGTGPAIIKYAAITYKSKPIKSWDEIPEIPRFTQSHISQRILPSEKTIQPLIYKGAQNRLFLTIDNDIKISLCYCSIYDQCWITDRSNDPLSVDECTIEQKLRFLQ